MQFRIIRRFEYGEENIKERKEDILCCEMMHACHAVGS